MAQGGVSILGVAGLELAAVRDAVNELREQIVAGEVTAPLECEDGPPLLTEAGQPIEAHRSIYTAQAAADQLTAVRQLIAAETTVMDAKIREHNASGDAHPTHLSI